MFKKILLPLDLSNKHGHAVNLAVKLVDPQDGEIVLLHVIETITGSSFEEERSFYSRLEKNARAHLAQTGETLKQRNIKFISEIRYGNRGPEVVRFANDMGIDLIVLTAPRVDPHNLSEGWGSLSYRVGLFSWCPVLLVK